MRAYLDSHTATTTANCSDRWTQYRKRRVNSLLRLQIANFIFLCLILSCMGDVHDATASAVLFNETCLWLIPTLLSLMYLSISVLYPSSELSILLDSADAWNRLSYFLNSIRFYRLVVNVCDAAGIYKQMYQDHEGSNDYGSIVIVMMLSTDVAEAYLWTSFNFPSPWAFIFCCTEAASMTLRLLSCSTVLKQYVTQIAYPIAFMLLYYLLLYLYYQVLDSFYQSSFNEITKVRLLSSSRAKELDGMNRSIKLALQYISGCLTKFESAGASSPHSRTSVNKLAGESMQVILRSVQHITLLLDNVVVLTKLEDGSFLKTTSGSVDLSGVLRELIHGLEDPTVPKLAIHIILNDAQTRSPMLRCSTAMLNSIISNVALYAMTMIRRRAFRQRVGYKPYLNVVGYIVESKKKNKKTENNVTSMQGIRSLWKKDDYSSIDSAGGSQMLRLVFDHNGDAAPLVDITTGTSRLGLLNLCSSCERKKDYDASPRRELLDGTEIFQVELITGTRPAHNVATRGAVYESMDIPVCCCRDAYSVNENRLTVGKLSPLTIATVDAVVKDCGGDFKFQKFSVAEEEDGGPRSIPYFNRLIVDIPCLERVSSNKKTVDKPGRSGKSSFFAHEPVATKDFKVCLVIAEKQLLSSLCVVLRDLQIPGDVIRVKKSGFSAEHMDVANVLKKKYSAILFDVESVGGELREIGFKGERVFFTPDSIVLESSLMHPNYEHVMPIPCPSFVIRQFVSARREGTADSLDVDPDSAPSIGSKKIEYLINLKRSLFPYEEVLQAMHRYFCGYTFRRAWNGFTSLLYFVHRFLYWMFLESIDASSTRTQRKKSIDASALSSISGGDHTEDLPHFGSQFSFTKFSLMIPRFCPNIEQKFLSWRVYNVDNGLMSHSATFVMSVCILVGVRLLAEYYRTSATSDDFDLDFFLSNVMSIVVVIAYVFVTRMCIKTEKTQYYFLYILATAMVVVSIASFSRDIDTVFYNQDYDVPISARSHSGALLMDFAVLMLPRQMLAPFLSLYWENTIVLILCGVLRSAAYVEIMFVRGYLHKLIYCALFPALVLSTCVTLGRHFELEYFRRLEYQTLCWHRFRASFLQTCRTLSWNEKRYPLKTLLKQRKKLFSDIGDILVDRGHDYLVPDMAENAKALNLGFLKLEKMHSILCFTDICASDLELSQDILLLKEEVSYIASVLELDAQRHNAEIFIHVDPALTCVRFDKQLFRMFLVNAVLIAVENIASDTTHRSRNKNAQGIPDAVEPGRSARAKSDKSIREVLIQIGVSAPASEQSRSDFDRIRAEVNYNFIKSQNNTAVRKESDQEYMTVAVVDNGATRDLRGIEAASSDKNHEEICKNVIENCLRGCYENEILSLPSRFRNVTRYSVPFGHVAPPVAPRQTSTEPRIGELWKTPSCGFFWGFKRSSHRYEYMRMLYSKRKKISDESKAIFDTTEEVDSAMALGSRNMIFVHPDINTGEMLIGNFRMHGWTCTVVSSLNSVLGFGTIQDMDLLLVCSSIFLGTNHTEFVGMDQLNYLGFFGAVMCLVDAFPPPNSPVNDLYKQLSIPVLDSTVESANDETDRALLDYIIGTNRHNDF